MKTTAPLLALGLLLMSLLGAGCASKPAVDWNSRVGSYTFDQAVTELGPPSSQTTLSDGRKVADWITGYTGSSGFSVGMGGYGSSGAMGVSHGVGTAPRAKILRLTFAPDGKLAAWTRTEN
jgi:hypothetical protein